ncbi:MAG: TetR/AcrR family transcriptional regulator, partial [Rhizobiaceae bacterium]
MRVSRVQAAENREAVINVASRLFREHGFDGIGLKDLMKGAGLTQGAFYKQFASKEDLAAQASRRAMESANHRWSAAAAANPQNPLEAVIAFYLSMGHRAERMDGCPVVALGSDAARQGADVKASFEAGIREYLE